MCIPTKSITFATLNLLITNYKLQIVDWVRVPYFLCGVRAGLPALPGDDTYETIAIPRQYACEAAFVIPVHGQSMRDFDFHDGDELIVSARAYADNGEFVIASINGEMTVKVYYEDGQGERWMLPGNPDYQPIHLSPEDDCRIIGVVTRVTHRQPHVSLRQCARILRSYTQPDTHTAHNLCTYIVPDAPRPAEDIEADLVRTAAQSASVFANCLMRLERQGCLDFGNDTVKTIFLYLKDWYGIGYSYANFSAVFSRPQR